MDSQLTHVASSLRPYLINKAAGTLRLGERASAKCGGSEREREREGHYYILLKRSKCNSAAGQNFKSATQCASWGVCSGTECVRECVKGLGF